MSNETFKSVFWGVQPQAVHKELEQLKGAHAEKIKVLQEQVDELIAKRDSLIKEKDSLEKLLVLPELSPRFLDMAQSRIDRTETLLKNAAEKDKSNIQQEYHTRHIANELKRKQIEDSIRQCREQFQTMMTNLNRMVENPLKNDVKNYRPNLVVVEPIREQPNLAGEQITGCADSQEVDLSLETLRYQYACGKKAGQDIVLDNGKVLIRQGEVITLEIVKEAQANNKLTELVKAMEAPEYKERLI